jgi:hypothetical protein
MLVCQAPKTFYLRNKKHERVELDFLVFLQAHANEAGCLPRPRFEIFAAAGADQNFGAGNLFNPLAVALKGFGYPVFKIMCHVR